MADRAQLDGLSVDLACFSELSLSLLWGLKVPGSFPPPGTVEEFLSFQGLSTLQESSQLSKLRLGNPRAKKEDLSLELA